MLRALVIVLSIALCLAAFDIIVLVGFLPQALSYLTTSYNSQNETWRGEISYFQLSLLLFILILFLFIIYDK